MSEHDEFVKKYIKHLEEEREAELKKSETLIQEFILFSKKKGIGLNWNNFDYLQTTGIIAKHPNLVYLLNNKVAADKEQLIDLDILEQEFEKRMMPGLYYSEKYIVMPNAYFRRGHQEVNSFAPRFIEEFFAYKEAGNKKYIAIDFDRVRINVDNRMYMELDTWIGAGFNQKVSEVKEGIVKLRPPSWLDSHDTRIFFDNTYSLDIKWTSKNGIRTFQAEEFKEAASKITKNGVDYHPVRYVHAEFDLSTDAFRHFDGAIHFYTEEEYYRRRDQDYNHNTKNPVQLKTLSQKLFKINGRVQTKDWVNLVCHYLTGNPLIHEYFDGKFPAPIADAVEKILKRRQEKT